MGRSTGQFHRGSPLCLHVAERPSMVTNSILIPLAFSLPWALSVSQEQNKATSVIALALICFRKQWKRFDTILFLEVYRRAHPFNLPAQPFNLSISDKLWTLEKNKGHFIILELNSGIIKWPLFFSKVHSLSDIDRLKGCAGRLKGCALR